MNKEVAVFKINEISQNINKLWSEISPKETNKMKQYWKDSACDECVRNIENVGSIVKEINKELELLKECWQKYD